MDAEIFSRRLRKMIRERMVTIKRLACDVGVSRNTVYGWVKGKTLPQTYYLGGIKKALSCKWEDLLGR